MSTLDPVPNISKITASPKKVKSQTDGQHLGETSSTTATSFTEEVRLQLKEWALATLGPLLVIVRITFIFILALLADTLIIIIINWSFGGIFSRNLFAAKLLEGIQILSALGTAAAYILYLIRSLFKDAKHIMEELRAESSKGKASS